jgi:hypothetical protein
VQNTSGFEMVEASIIAIVGAGEQCVGENGQRITGHGVPVKRSSWTNSEVRAVIT